MFSNSTKSSSLDSVSIGLMPVPTGILRPMITFSLRPLSLSTRPLIAALIRTLVVSWKDAADKKESDQIETLVIPSNKLV